MKVGDVIGGVKLTSAGSSAGGGRSIWAFGRRDGCDFFVKRFLTPKYPTDDMPGSKSNKMKAKERCDVFERRNNSILSTLKTKVKSGGSVVAPIEFMRIGPNYYKIYDKIDVSSITLKEISKKNINEKLLIAQVLSHSVHILHSSGIVHGDIKPDNILIKKTAVDSYTAKLIDFDDAYFDSDPPGPDVIVGDFLYYSPEILNYVKSEDAKKASSITTKSDIFALGLVLCQFMSGSLPRYESDKYSSAASSICAGAAISSTGQDFDTGLEALIVQMLSELPHARPDAEQIRERLKSLRRGLSGVESLISDALPSRLRVKSRREDAVVGDKIVATDSTEVLTSRVLIKPRR
jgi:eukaryotic-like serine/threonine-protein kinase